MKNRLLRGLGLCLAITLAAFLCTTPAISAGFGIYEWSNRGDAIGGSLLGTADDASTVAYNPAGVAHFSNWRMLFGVTTITPMSDVKVTNMYDGKTSTGNTESTSHVVPHFYVAGPVWEGTDFDRLSFGLGVFSRFGLATEFYQGWAGRYNSYKADITSYSVNPNLALKINDHWSVAGGIEIMMFNVDLRQRLDATKIFAAQGMLPALAAQGIPTTINDPNTSVMDVDQKLSGQSHGFGFNLAVMYEPSEEWGFGATYRSEVKQDIGGQVHFQKSPTVAALLPTMYNFTTADAEITLPDQISLGVNYKPIEKLMIGLSAIYTRWSSYDQLKVVYSSNQVGVTESASQKDCHHHPPPPPNRGIPSFGMAGSQGQLCLRPITHQRRLRGLSPAGQRPPVGGLRSRVPVQPPPSGWISTTPTCG